jgi:hypothetical protein
MDQSHALQASPLPARPVLPDDAAEPTRKERRDRSRARRRAMLDLSRQIFDLHDRGATNDEIAKAVDRTPRAVRAPRRESRRFDFESLYDGSFCAHDHPGAPRDAQETRARV